MKDGGRTWAAPDASGEGPRAITQRVLDAWCVDLMNAGEDCEPLAEPRMP
jgi:hypothetical protein